MLQKFNKYAFTVGFQESVASLMLREPQFLDRYRDVLDPQYFTKDDLSTLSRLMLQHHERYRQPPQHLDQLVYEYAAKLNSNPHEAAKIAGPLLQLTAKLTSMDLSDSEYVTDSVVKFGRFSALTRGLEDALEYAAKDDSYDGDGYDNVLSIIQKSLTVGKGSENDLISADALEDLLEINASQVTRRVPSGIELLDLDMNGGLGDGEIGALVAPSGVGKSLGLNEIAAYAATVQKKATLYISCELNKEACLNRLGARIVGMDARALENPTPEVRKLYHQKLKEIREEFGYFPLQIQYFTPKSATVNSLRSTITNLKSAKNFHPELVIVDYADELRSGGMYKGDSSNTYLEMGSVFKELRSLGKDLGFPIWTASQVNREGVKVSRNEKKSVCDMYSLADSYMKVMVADAIITMNQTIEERNEGTARLFVAKLRRGPAGRIIDVNIDYPKMRLEQAQFQMSHEQYYSNN